MLFVYYDVCVIKVGVKFEKFHFYYALNVVALADVRKTLMEVAKTQSHPLPGMQEVQKYGNLVIKLNESELSAVTKITLPITTTSTNYTIKE